MLVCDSLSFLNSGRIIHDKVLIFNLIFLLSIYHVNKNKDLAQ